MLAPSATVIRHCIWHYSSLLLGLMRVIKRLYKHLGGLDYTPSCYNLAHPSALSAKCETNLEPHRLAGCNGCHECVDVVVGDTFIGSRVVWGGVAYVLMNWEFWTPGRDASRVGLSPEGGWNHPLLHRSYEDPFPAPWVTIHLQDSLQ